jgi:hypothetical protein
MEDPQWSNLTVDIEGVSVPYCAAILYETAIPEPFKTFITPPVPYLGAESSFVLDGLAGFGAYVVFSHVKRFIHVGFYPTH